MARVFDRQGRIPLAAGQLSASLLAGRIVAARGTRLPLMLGDRLLALGGFLLIPVTATTALIYVLAAYAVFGFGVGLISPAITNTAVSVLPRDQVGVAGALAARARQFGSPIAVAITGALICSSAVSSPGANTAASAVLGAFGLAALALGILSTGKWAQERATRTAKKLTP